METIAVSEPGPGLALVELKRPEAANALSTRMGEELLAAWRDLAARPDLRCAVLAGAGRHFCAGADLKERDGMSDEAWSRQHVLFEEMIRAQLAVPYPVIAAVQGAAMGGGLEMMLACDFACAAEGARFGLPEARLGIMPGLGGTQNLARAVGPRLAMRLLATAEPMSADEALRHGLVCSLGPEPELRAAALALAAKVAANAPLSLKALKRVVRDGLAMDLPTAMDLELEHYNRLFRSRDRIEGVRAFNEKRPPIFRGE